MSRLLRCVWVFVLVVGALAVIPSTAAFAATTAPITGLSARGGYNSVELSWRPPADTRLYRGVSIWRYEGNVDPAPAPVLVAKVDQTRSSYTDRNLTVPPSGLWAYKVYTRDAVKGGIQPQDVADWMTSAMSGRVTDARGNGVGNVFVSVGYSAWSSGGQTTTASDGTWLIDGVTGNSAVACFDPRNATGGISTTGYGPECFDSVPSIPNYGRTARTVTLTRGTLARGIDASLDPAGVVAGVVRNAAGRPLAHAGVTVLRSDSQVYRTAVTGSDGSYRFVGLAAGQYTSCVYQPYTATLISPASPTGYLPTCSDGSFGDARPQSFAVTVGVTTTADIRLVAAGAISGRLLGPDGTPRVGELPNLGGTYSPDGRYTRTDASGAYRITGLRPGRYTVCFGGTPSTGTGEDFDPGLSPRCWNGADPLSPTKIDVGQGQLVKGISVTQFANATISGRVADAAGTPVTNAFVSVDGVIQVGTAADGTYRFGVVSGTHTVCFDASQARGPSSSGYEDQCWQAKPSSGSPTPVVVKRGGQVTGVDAALAPAAGVQVTVVDAAGTPLRNATVYLYGPGGGGPNGQTNSSGVIVFKRVYLGDGTDLTAYLADDSYWNATPKAPHGYASVETPVSAAAGRLVSVRVVAPALGTLAGTVRGPDGAPVADALVTVEGSNYLPSWSTASDGSYAVPDVPPGTYTMCASNWVGTGAEAHYATACWNGAADRSTATPIAVGDRADVTGVDVVLR